MLMLRPKIREFPKALTGPLIRILGLECLRKVFLSGFRSFPPSLLNCPTYITELDFNFVNISMQDPSEAPLTSHSPGLLQPNVCARARTPLFLWLRRCTPQTYTALAKLVKDQAEPFASHWIEKLALVSHCPGLVDDEVGLWRDLLRAVKTSQSSVDRPEESGLSRLFLKIGK